MIELCILWESTELRLSGGKVTLGLKIRSGQVENGVKAIVVIPALYMRKLLNLCFLGVLKMVNLWSERCGCKNKECRRSSQWVVSGWFGFAGSQANGEFQQCLEALSKAA